MTFAKRVLLFSITILIILFVSNQVKPYIPYAEQITNVAGIALLAVAFSIDHYSQKRLNDILLVSCDPDTYVEKLRHILNGVIEKRRPALANIRRLSLCAGLYAGGHFEEMENELCKITIFPTRTAAIYRFYYLQQHFYNNLRKGEILLATDLLATMRVKPITFKLKPKEQSIIRDALTCMGYQLRMVQSNYDEAEAYFQDAFKVAVNPYGRVSAQFNLGRIYQHTGQPEKAHSAYHYVMSHGNKLYAVNRSASALNDLDNATTEATV